MTYADRANVYAKRAREGARDRESFARGRHQIDWK